MVLSLGLEPRTLGLEDRCSIQLSYESKKNSPRANWKTHDELILSAQSFYLEGSVETSCVVEGVVVVGAVAVVTSACFAGVPVTSSTCI